MSRRSMEKHIAKEDECFKIKDFNGYDYVLLGDIHIHQYLGKNKRIADQAQHYHQQGNQQQITERDLIFQHI